MRVELLIRAHFRRVIFKLRKRQFLTDPRAGLRFDKREKSR